MCISILYTCTRECGTAVECSLPELTHGNCGRTSVVGSIGTVCVCKDSFFFSVGPKGGKLLLCDVACVWSFKALHESRSVIWGLLHTVRLTA